MYEYFWHIIKLQRVCFLQWLQLNLARCFTNFNFRRVNLNLSHRHEIITTQYYVCHLVVWMGTPALVAQNGFLIVAVCVCVCVPDGPGHAGRHVSPGILMMFFLFTAGGRYTHVLIHPDTYTACVCVCVQVDHVSMQAVVSLVGHTAALKH